MRLIGTFDKEQEAFAFYAFLLKEGIQNIYEPFTEGSGQKRYHIWIYEEDDLEEAEKWITQYKENPNDPKFQNVAPPAIAATPPPPKYEEISEKEELKWRRPARALLPKRRLSPFTLTNLIIILCAFLFIWNSFDEEQIFKEKGPFAVQIALTPLMQNLLFDLPSSYQYIEQLLHQFPIENYKEEKDLPKEAKALLYQAEDTTSWQGIYTYFSQKQPAVKLFEKIRQGQVWRLFTPCLLHRDFLHILFNMIWVWILLKQIEQRMRIGRICLLILVIAVVSNVAQYLVSGPYFLGFSGVVVGLAGFIWIRQKVAPWEGYPLQKGTFLFLAFFVLAMFALELLTFSLQLLSVIKISPNIANTAHIVGGLVGMFLGKLPFFSRRAS